MISPTKSGCWLYSPTQYSKPLHYTHLEDEILKGYIYCLFVVIDAWLLVIDRVFGLMNDLVYHFLTPQFFSLVCEIK